MREREKYGEGVMCMREQDSGVWIKERDSVVGESERERGVCTACMCVREREREIM